MTDGTPVAAAARSTARPAPIAAAPATVRRHNLGLVLELLLERGPRSRAGIADATGLTKATVSKLVTELQKRRLVRDADADADAAVPAAPGRPATLVEIDPVSVVALTIEIGVDATAVSVIGMTGDVIHRSHEDSDNRSRGAEAVLHDASARARRAVRDATREGRVIAGIAVAVPGLTADGRVLHAPNLRWRDVPVESIVQRALRTSTPLALDNEANLAALAEARVREERSFIVVSADVGVGAGVIADGRLLRGAHGFGGELGHFVIDADGRRCACGNRGCLETVVGKDHLARACGVRPMPGSAAADRLRQRAAAGDERVLAGLHHGAEALARGLASAVSLLDPDVVVLGGYLAALTPWMAPSIEAQLDRRVLGSRFVRYRIEGARAGADAPGRGGAWSVVRRVIDDPLSVPRPA